MRGSLPHLARDAAVWCARVPLAVGRGEIRSSSCHAAPGHVTHAHMHPEEKAEPEEEKAEPKEKAEPEEKEADPEVRADLSEYR